MLKIGILGCGSFMQRRILPLELKGVEILAIQKREPEEVAEQFAIPKAYRTREALLADRHLDLIYIGTLNTMHYEDLLACADAGKAVLCEKPLTRNSVEAEEIVALFEKKGLPLFVGHHLRFKEPLLRAKKMVQEGKIGRVISYRMAFSVPVPASSWKRNPSLGGRPLLEAGVHLIDTIRFLSEEKVEEVWGKEIGVTHFGQMVLESGPTASFEVSFEGIFRHEFEIVGTEGVIQGTLRQSEWSGEQLKWMTREGEFAFPIPVNNPYQRELEHVAAVMRGEEESCIAGREGLENLRLIDALYESEKFSIHK